jgi:hypothetical protein
MCRQQAEPCPPSLAAHCNNEFSGSLTTRSDSVHVVHRPDARQVIPAPSPSASASASTSTPPSIFLLTSPALALATAALSGVISVAIADEGSRGIRVVAAGGAAVAAAFKLRENT